MEHTIAQNFSSNQIEADIKIDQHDCNSWHSNPYGSSKPINIRILAADTNILIIMLYHIKHMIEKENVVWVEGGVGSSKRFINVNEMHQELSESVRNGLPGFHAISGCDFSPSTFNKGKAKCYKAALSNSIFIDALHEIGHLDSPPQYEQFIQTDLFSKIEKSLYCKLYGLQSGNYIDDAFFLFFVSS